MVAQPSMGHGSIRGSGLGGMRGRWYNKCAVVMRVRQRGQRRDSEGKNEDDERDGEMDGQTKGTAGKDKHEAILNEALGLTTWYKHPAKALRCA